MISLHLVKTSTGGEWALRVMRDLVKLGEEVHVAMPLDGPLVEEYKKYGIHIHELHYSLSGIICCRSNLQKIIDKVKPDIIHSHFVLTTLIMRTISRRFKIPRIFQVPGPLHLEHFIYRNADILSANKKYDYWIPTCKWSYDKYINNGISPDRLLLTYYGGDDKDSMMVRGKLRKELALSERDIIVGMVAYMYTPKKYLGQKRGLKGHEDLIDAIAMLQDKYKNLHVVFVGGAWVGADKYAENVIRYGQNKCRNIHFLGTRTDVPEIYGDFDMVVHPSHSENLGGAGESLGKGIPTISTNVGGFPDIVIPGKTGILVPPNNPKAIANAIERYIKDPDCAKREADFGKKYVKALLNSQNTSREVFKFHNFILKHHLT